MFPAARLGDLTVTGDAITGPGVATVMIGSMPASVVGDIVTGAACVGAISMGSTAVIVGGRPAARITSQVTGANPITGVPVTTIVGPPCCPKVMIGDMASGGGGAGGGGAAAGAAGGGGAAISESAAQSAQEVTDAVAREGPAKVASAPANQKGPLQAKERSKEKTWIGIELKDFNNSPIADQDFQVTLDNGQVVKGRTDQKGYCRIEDVDPDKGEVDFIKLPDSEEVELSQDPSQQETKAEKSVGSRKITSGPASKQAAQPKGMEDSSDASEDPTQEDVEIDLDDSDFD